MEVASGPATCAICGVTYATDVVDVEHQSRHYKFLACGLALGYYPEQIAARERRKRLGHQLVNESSELSDKVFGALQVLRAWFDRSLDSAINGERWAGHPLFEAFVSMVDLEQHFPDEVSAVLRRRFGTGASGLDKGNCWQP